MTDNGTSVPALTSAKGGRIYGWPTDPAENANMRGGKSSAYDGGHRVPLFVQLARRKASSASATSETLTAHFDITPTLMDLCNLRAA